MTNRTCVGALPFRGSCLVADATATHARTVHGGDRIDPETSHRVALAHLDGEFATVVESGDLLRN